jgi:hypothetical protein
VSIADTHTSGEDLRMLRVELRRAFGGRPCIVACLIAGAALAFGLYNYGMYYGLGVATEPSFFYNAYDATIWSQNAIIGLFVPVIAVLPFADSLALDRTSGYLRLILMRTTYTRYAWAKFVACALSGGAVVAGPLALVFGVANMLYPRGINVDATMQRIITTPDALGPFGVLYHTNPDLYIFALIFTCFVGGAAYASLGLAVATITDNRYVVLATPFVLYHVVNYLIANMGYPQWLLSTAFAPQLALDVTWVQVFPTLVGVMSSSGVIFLLKSSQAKARA